MDWQELTDTLSTDDALTHLTPAQTDAFVTVLVVVMHADGRVGTLERESFRDQLDQLPFYRDKHVTAEQIEAAIEAASAAHGEAGFKRIIDTVAVNLDDAHLREVAFRMAATLAYADLNLHASESAVLGWLAAAFNLAPEALEAIYAELN
jgi:uncharacterized tellurite resistance protein B-like protein